jgi:two-component system, OmpR family, copper resistance phosphate regulon response regulator CusR
MKLLIIEDDDALTRSLQQGLVEAGYDVTVASTLPTAIATCAAHRFDLLVLDLGLPGGSGLHVLDELRRRRDPTPVIILTARNGVTPRVAGLDRGADDYLVKPFAFAELAARIRAVLRRARESDTRLCIADLQLDLLQRSAVRGGRDLQLSPREFDVLAYLARNLGQVVSREMLSRDVFQIRSRATPVENLIEVHMYRLRAKLNDGFSAKLIETVRGVGYLLTAPA